VKSGQRPRSDGPRAEEETIASDPLTILLVLVFVAVAVVPPVARALGMPVIVAELLVGIPLGVSWLGLVPEGSELISFLADFGLVYIMFLAGLEVDVDVIRSQLGRTVSIGLVSIGAAFAAGVALAPVTGVDPLLEGTIFSTTSMSLVLPLTKELAYEPAILDLLLGSVALVDILSILLLGFNLALLQGSSQATFFYSLAAVSTLFLIPWAVSRWNFQDWLESWLFEEPHFEDAVRFSFATVFLLAAVSDALGFHGITGAFIAGLVISEIAPGSSSIEDRLESFGYGFFIPLFFVITGARVDVPALVSNAGHLRVLAALIVVGIAVKVVAVWAASRWQGLTNQESLAFGLFHSARVSLIIAAAEAGRSIGLLSETTFGMFIVLSIVSALLGPFLGKLVLTHDPEDHAATAAVEG
jgi:Kef-type K+ transport system membrane component KefB